MAAVTAESENPVTEPGVEPGCDSVDARKSPTPFPATPSKHPTKVILGVAGRSFLLSFYFTSSGSELRGHYVG